MLQENLLAQEHPQLDGDSAMPPERPAPMPEQSLTALSAGFPRASINPGGVTSKIPPRVMVVGSALLLSLFAIYEMLQVFSVAAVTPLEYLVLLLFAVNFCWIALAFCSGVAGFIELIKHRFVKARVTQVKVLTDNVAILMPTYNEQPDRVFSAVETMALDLVNYTQDSKEHQCFSWFILSDTTDPSIALAEEQAFWLLRRRLAGRARVFYRRRRKNTARKSGNVEDFCTRWGSAYDSLLVLDADSVMQSQCIVELGRRMQADPDAGLIQTIPYLVKGVTLLARLQQFAARFYGPIIGTGLAWWVQKEGNFWGHNAIIRTQAFMQAAGLPVLKGKPPFGGHIMSHDFVEAALIRRAGWSVQIAADLPGSFEECPPSIIDMAVRDRRWCQGNLQHSRVLPAKGLHWISRLHLVTGIMSYLSSPFWLLLILSGLLLALQAHYIRPEYFTDQFSLFPKWPVMDSDRALRLFYITMGILFGPKIFGSLLLLTDKQYVKILGGRLRITASILLEVLVSALIAPIMMFIHCGAVFAIISGKDSGWAPQRRDDGSLPWSDVIYRHRYHVLAGILLGYAAYLDSWTLLAWMSPALIGLWIAVPLSAFTASQKVGKWFRAKRLLSTPEELEPPQILTSAAAARGEYEAALKDVWDVRMLLDNPELMALHMQIMDKLPTHIPGGKIESMDAIARVKVQEAQTQEALLANLDNKELGYILGNPLLLQTMQRLPKSYTESDLVSIC
ncbi:glucans biosynthesis glucosyltransferase MdoH [Shewanella dokdonensis]|uniref:Glucans biosynthesis glucosyltransferase H n=1 Tax=Shewanella dokdonensis TaxID=712036 RepID=A0ABX8DE56_9GAMM|nr:glucans biosynthesis glucosyltransferase MdoH [Shewanella dokdonensis]MCL1073114.1 glucans biosynthesis glucosyltransferase MdoH [Shewanella dokdonensis]QVK23005.1 glucans biosynthesis glucosyltransferase MdoH [Shewanella dokdonensis]